MPTDGPHERARESIGFAEAVQQYIAPLLAANGFTCTEQTPYVVRFLSPMVCLAVYHEPYSYEIGLAYALRATPTERFDLPDLLDAALGPDHREQAFLQASTHERVVFCIHLLAGYLQKYGEAVVMGDVAAFQQVRDAARRRRGSHMKQVLHHPIREAAEAVWADHYGTFIPLN